MVKKKKTKSKTTKKNKKKTKKKSNSALSRAQLISELTEGITDLAEVTITIPLSKVTKKIHTRMFIQTKISLPKLENMKELGQIFQANAYYYNDKYVRNVWFVKKVKISVSPSGESMTLTLLPFNESYKAEADTLKGLTESKSKTNKSNTSTSDVKLCDNDKFLKDIVSKAIGTKSDKVAMAKACHKYYKDHHVYRYKETSVESDYARGFKSLWNQEGQSCGPGAATLYYMFKCIGLSPKIMNGHNHYWIQVEIDGDTYYCDQAGAEGAHNTRVMSTSTGDGTVWHGATGGSVRKG